MPPIFIDILLWIGIVILAGSFIFLVFLAFGGLNSKSPFAQIPVSILEDIYKIMEIDEKSVVYHISCGDGRVLCYLSKKNPKAKYIGFENNPSLLVFSKIRSWFYRKFLKRDINIDYYDINQISLSEATHIFTYLYPNNMDAILTSIENQLKPGARLISISFKFTLRNPNKEFDLGRSKYKLARKAYLYEF